ncbi:MAG: TIGR02147 family protein [Fibrobacter sp.]|nr:TIGR02147 family protein [Fibrobacter sp.]
MKPIVEYRDYRKFIQDYYDEQKRTSSFTWRDFAALAGFGSPVFLKYVCEGKKNLSQETATRVANAMGLNGYEVEFFQALVLFNHAKDDVERKKAIDAMQKVASANNIKILETEEFAYFDSWKNPVIRELAPAMPGAKPSKMAEVCKHKVSADEVAETLRFLVGAGLLNKDSKGNFSQTDKAISSGDGDFVPLAVRNMHRQMGSFALDALDNLPVEERQFTGLTLGISEEEYAQVLKELAKCRRNIMAIASRSEKTERVYRLNMQMFPLTEKIG